MSSSETVLVWNLGLGHQLWSHTVPDWNLTPYACLIHLSLRIQSWNGMETVKSCNFAMVKRYGLETARQYGLGTVKRRGLEGEWSETTVKWNGMKTDHRHVWIRLRYGKRYGMKTQWYQ